MNERHADIAIVGAGAAGLMAAIFAGRTAQATGRMRRIIALDGAGKIGAKILVSGGGRCNVTHDVVDETAFAGASPNAIKKVLRRFPVEETVEFFRTLDVHLKREDTGKLFPVTDRAATVLDALIREARRAGVDFIHPARVSSIQLRPHGDDISAPVHDDRRMNEAFELSIENGDPITASRVILATGGKSLPKTGSDGAGYRLATSLGHTLTTHILPALVPLVLDNKCFIRELSGLTLPAAIELRSSTGKRLLTFTDSTLCTHFGLSGPGVLDISRHYLHAIIDDPGAALFMNWLPGESASTLDAALVEFSRFHGRAGIARMFAEKLPQRLVRSLCEFAGVDPATPANSLPREARRALVAAVTGMKLPVVADRGFTVAEVTAGGVPLKELRLETMESRPTPGLYLCGEICDVDGRIGGYNFQWAWASGRVAGESAADSLRE